MSRRVPLDALVDTLRQLYTNDTTYIHKLPYDLIRYYLQPMLMEHVKNATAVLAKYHSDGVEKFVKTAKTVDILLLTELLVSETWASKLTSLANNLYVWWYIGSDPQIERILAILRKVIEHATHKVARDFIINVLLSNINMRHIVENLRAEYPSIFNVDLYRSTFLLSICRGVVNRCMYLTNYYDEPSHVPTAVAACFAVPLTLVDALTELIVHHKQPTVRSNIQSLMRCGLLTDISTYSNKIWSNVIAHSHHITDESTIEYLHKSDILPITIAYRLAFLKYFAVNNHEYYNSVKFLYELGGSVDVIVDDIDKQLALTAPQLQTIKKLLATHLCKSSD